MSGICYNVSVKFMGTDVRVTVTRLAAALVALLLGVSVGVPTAHGRVPGPLACAISVPVLVVGGTPAGVAAAVTAARMGTPVLLTEARPYLGGDLTGSMLNMFDMDYGPAGQQLSRGVFSEVFGQLGITFDVELAKHVFLRQVRREPLITLRLSTRPVQVFVKGQRVVGVVVEDEFSHDRETVCAKRIVDATDDADIAAMAGVPYSLGREGSGVDHAMMAATLVFEVRGIHWREVLEYVTNTSGRLATRGGMYHGNAWGYGDIMRLYRPIEPGIGIYDLNIGRQDNRTVLINGLLVYGVDGTDPASVADGMLRARVELPKLIEYLRTFAPGFRDAELVRPADYLYIRETRHIRGLTTLTVQDIVDARVFWDAVGVASYPIDLHPYRPGERNPYAAHRYVYTIPLRALVPVGITNLLVASRSISASYEAAGSARVIPTTMEEGQAAGAATVLSIHAKTLIPRFTEDPALVHELQGTLYTQGQYLLPETIAAAAGNPVHPWPGSAPISVKPQAQAPSTR
ncbi:MAG TPA: FAD-dependent oxidoreductase [bacterium]|nr:FAD-dependent oxidoreductase [bacterium]